MAHALLVVLGLMTAGQDPAIAARPRVSYHAVATVGEPARLIHGTLSIRFSPPAGDTSGSVTLDPGSAHVSGITLDGTDAGAIALEGGRLSIPWEASRPHGARLIELEFTSLAAPSTTAAPAGDRHLEFRAWLPRVLGDGGRLDPVPATFLVALDAPADQVLGATGVPLCGDPGWTGARRPAGRPVTFQRDAYAAPADTAARRLASGPCPRADAGRNTVIWYARDVRDMALVMDPAFRYEEGDILERAARVLYLPGDERTWGSGVAIRRSETALAWLHELFDGPAPAVYPWPQVTTVHGRGGAGSADAMLAVVDAPDQETVLRQIGRLYLASAIAVAPRDAAWLDQGLSWFQSDLFFETQGRRATFRRLERAQLDDELDGRARPVLPPLPEGRLPDSAAVERGRFLLHRLRAAIGDEAMGRVLHAYWARARLGSADESLFVAMVDSVAGGTVGEDFATALRDATPVDYAVAAAHREPLPDGRWRTTVDVRRLGRGHLPLELRVLGDSEVATARAGGAAQRETITVETATRPRRVVLDPRLTSHDWNVLNNQRTFGFHLGPDIPVSDYLDPYFARPSRRDRLARGWAPVGWYDDAGGWTAGLRLRENYLDRFDLDELWATYATGWGASGRERDFDGRLVIRNPTWLRSPGVGERLELARVEGRVVAALGLEKEWGRRGAGLTLSWVGATTSAYLDPARWERAATLELTATGRAAWESSATTAHAVATVAVGRTFPGAGTGPGRVYARVTAGAAIDRAYGATHLRARVFAGAALTAGHLLPQRRLYLAGADPYEQLSNPFLRSRGALLTRGGVFYQDPGGAGLRGLDPALGSRQVYGTTLEVEQDLWKGSGGLARRLALAVFGDGALADGDLDPSGRLAPAGDAGFGLRLDHRIGTTAFQTRFDFPLWISLPRLAQDTHPGTRRLGFRWSFSFAPPW